MTQCKAFNKQKRSQHRVNIKLLGHAGGYMDLMTAEQAGHFLQSQANHQSSSLANGDMPHGQHAQATHNGHQVAAGLAEVTAYQSLPAFASVPSICFVLWLHSWSVW